jgi:hypothetical protein
MSTYAAGTKRRPISCLEMYPAKRGVRLRELDVRLRAVSALEMCLA